MENLKDKILDKIKAGEAKQTPKWQFQLKEFLVWFGVGILIAIAALSFSAIIFNFQNADWALRASLGITRSRFFFIHFPYFWIIILTALAILAYCVFRHTKKGYRYALPVVIFTVAILITSIGLASHLSFRTGHFMEKEAMIGFPYYNVITRPRQKIWFNPEKGFLTGSIVSPYVNGKFNLSDINKNVWLISCDKCVIHTLVEMEEDEKVKIIGEKIDNVNFNAFEVSPLFGPPEFNKIEFKKIMNK